jgi:hypothetical protein
VLSASDHGFVLRLAEESMHAIRKRCRRPWNSMLSAARARERSVGSAPDLSAKTGPLPIHLGRALECLSIHVCARFSSVHLSICMTFVITHTNTDALDTYTYACTHIHTHDLYPHPYTHTTINVSIHRLSRHPSM